MKEKRVKGYPFDRMRRKEELKLKTYEYDLPFNYPNITVWRKNYYGGEFHGIEFFTRNEPSAMAKLTRVNPDEWTLMQTSFTVPPETASAEFRLDVAGMAADETLVIADAFAGVAPDSWQEHRDIPAGVRNIISNPSLKGDKIPPAGWGLDSAGTGSITREKGSGKNPSGLKLKGAMISLFTEFPVKPGQRLIYAVNVKANHRFPKTVWLFPKWKNRQGLYLSDEAGDGLVIEEKEPIVGVTVIGSACTPPGYVMLEAEPYGEFYRRGDFIRCLAPLRFKHENLWGCHLRADQWITTAKDGFHYEKIPEGMLKRYPGMKNCGVKAHYQEHPLAGMSCAVFEIPKSKKVVITGGSASPGWFSDNYPSDDNYSFRTVRITVTRK